MKKRPKYVVVSSYRRKGYHRKGYTRRGGVRVSACYVPPTKVKKHKMRVWRLKW